MIQRERVIKYLLTMPKNTAVLIEYIQKELNDISTGSLSSILTILSKTIYFERTGVGKKAAFIRVKQGSFQEIIDAFRKKDLELYGQFKTKSYIDHKKNVKRAVVKSSAQGVVPSPKPSSKVSPAMLHMYLDNILKSSKKHLVDEIECIFKEFEELRTFQNLVEKFIKGDKK